ncbi:hypothetical protein G7079_06020 [Thermomonas sp. HDW16]|nr:hypothetical protein [Thermomonas sp. HDW16]QIL20333.1 hypothetical protein G7079_06020 [Thermomonas sp. HDW16]
MSQSNNKPIALVIGAAVATGTLVAGSLFSMQAMAHGYMQDAATSPAKAGEAKAAEGKCGEGKCGEGKCGSSQTAAKGSGASVGKPNPGKHHTMADMDTDKDGRMSRAEFVAAHKPGNVTSVDDWETLVAKQFRDHDLDGDGFITQAEMDKHHADMKGNAEGKCGEGKCGEGKCGSKKADAAKDGKAAEGKCGEGKCGSM